MTELKLAKWVKDNLGPHIRQALIDTKETIYTEDLLAAMVMRETGFLISRYADQGLNFKAICDLMKGDYGKRTMEKEKQYHGFGFWQIDIDSYPVFIKAGNWKNSYMTCVKAIKVLDEKRQYLLTHVKTFDLRAVVAAYNCGQGNVVKAITAGKDVDYFTFNKDYSKEIWRFRKMYMSLKDIS